MSLAGGISERDRRALVLLAVALVVAAGLYFFLPGQSGRAGVPSAAASGFDVAAAQQRLVRLRQVAATVPAREAVLKQSVSDLQDRERGMIQADTAPQAEAALVEIARRVGKDQDLDLRGGEFGAPKVVGDYGLVYATVTFECHVEQLVNFLSDLSRIPELVAPEEERVLSGNPKDKTVSVRIVLAGVVAKKLVPQKKGPLGF